MVIDNASSLFSFLEAFDSSDTSHREALEAMIKKYPNFHILKPFYLKSIEKQKPDLFDQFLSHTAIATYDRQLLYEFLENPKTLKTKNIPKKEKIKEPVQKTKKKVTRTSQPLIKEKKIPEELPFAEWASLLKVKKINQEPHEINEKFKLFDSFIEKKRTIKPRKEKVSKDDLSAKSLASTDELMTETLAKVFVKQNKYDNAIQAYQILSLKYPEKNSFFADQIKEIKRLQKLKE
ncbi:hypothetical protein N9C47_04380 [Flavobacteriaceae bacterium]|jgi:hypothetical protein|nr:hypothetical protein [Flavobacteriaceae bacterium]MDA9844070.1 hypothetical protein [Flavobacteriaceae bacterium]MDA9878863.1 hypothetical protein [Flavobacteriaceae bacterium]